MIKITQKELNEMLKMHDLFIKSDEENGIETNFENMDLSGLKFINKKMWHIEFQNCNLSKCKFKNCEFNKFYINKVDLTRASIINCEFNFGYIDYSDFKGASIINSRMYDSRITDSNILESNCFEMNIEMSKIIHNENFTEKFKHVYKKQYEDLTAG